jgi:hypothetical protein
MAVTGSLSVAEVVFIAGGVYLLFLPALANRSERVRTRIRALYESRLIPYFTRATIPLSPLMGVFVLLLGLRAFVPTEMTGWWLFGWLLFGAITFNLCYRTPPPLMPRWLREEVQRGQTSLARPTRLDWIHFWIVEALVVGGLGVLFLANVSEPFRRMIAS